MAGAGGRSAAALTDALFARTSSFEFEQAVRLLARLHPERAPVGGDADPAEELVRFAADYSAVFPGADVKAAAPARDGMPAQLTVCFLGVASPSGFGALPRRYAEEVRRLLRERHTALRDFFDLFNHRLISLFYRASERQQPVLLFERGPDNPLERALAALLGLGAPALAGRLQLADRALFGRAGLLALRPLPALALAALLRSVFGVPVRIEQFRRSRHRLEPAERSRLGAAHARLGAARAAAGGEGGGELVLGEQIELVDARFRVQLGPLGAQQYVALLPDGARFRALCELVRFATRAELEFDVQLLLAAREAPPLRLGPGTGRLGWSSWLASPLRRGAELLADVVLRPGAAGEPQAGDVPAAAGRAA